MLFLKLKLAICLTVNYKLSYIFNYSCGSCYLGSINKNQVRYEKILLTTSFNISKKFFIHYFLFRKSLNFLVYKCREGILGYPLESNFSKNKSSFYYSVCGEVQFLQRVTSTNFTRIRLYDGQFFQKFTNFMASIHFPESSVPVASKVSVVTAFGSI